MAKLFTHRQIKSVVDRRAELEGAWGCGEFNPGAWHELLAEYRNLGLMPLANRLEEIADSKFGVVETRSR